MERFEIEISSIEELVELVCNIPDGVILEVNFDPDKEEERHEP